MTIVSILLILAIIAFGLNAAVVASRINLDALGKALVVGAALATVWP